MNKIKNSMIERISLNLVIIPKLHEGLKNIRNQGGGRSPAPLIPGFYQLLRDVFRLIDYFGSRS